MTTPPGKRPLRKSLLFSTGWLSYSIFFNILNTIVYSTLYPNLLKSLTSSTASFSVGFSIINTLTTLLSAILLPLLGSLTDQLNYIKLSLIFTSILGWLVTLILILALIPLKLLNIGWISMIFTQIIYVLAMFFLRISVMNNNALLPCFAFKSRSILSILGNCLGFSVNLVGLAIIRLWPDSWTKRMDGAVFGISVEGWWIVAYTVLAGVVGLWMVQSPSGDDAPPQVATTAVVSDHSFDAEVPALSEAVDGDEEIEEYIRDKEQEVSLQTPSLLEPLKPRKSILEALKLAFKSLFETVIHWKSNAKYFNSWIFLFSYVFFSGPGVVFTVSFTFIFISIYPEIGSDLNASVDLNFYYKIFMVVGVFFGLAFDKVSRMIFKSSKFIDLVILFVQNIIFGVLMLLLLALITFGVEYKWVLWSSMPIGFFYSWNASVARGLMSKLIPMEKKGEFMGFYSTFTYLGITVVSAIDAIVKFLGAPPQTLLFLLFLWSIPGYIFLVVLGLSVAREAQVERRSQFIDLDKQDEVDTTEVFVPSYDEVQDKSQVPKIQSTD